MILVTGGTGLVGSHVLLKLTGIGYKVRALKRENSSTVWVERIFKWYKPDNYKNLLSLIDWVDGDVNDIFSLHEIMDGIKQVYHCAAMVSYLPGEKNTMLKVNVEGTANVVNVALYEGVEKICHCSSISSLGFAGNDVVVDENCFWETSHCNSNYAISKFGSEREIWRGSEEGLDVIIVNPSVIIGPGDPSRSSGQIINSILKGLKYYSSGITGFVEVRDVASIMIKLMNNSINNERFIINSENLAYKELFDKIANWYGIKPPKYNAGNFICEVAWRVEKIRCMITGNDPLITKETAKAANKKTKYSNQKIKEMIDYQFYTIDEAVSNACAFLKEHYDK